MPGFWRTTFIRNSPVRICSGPHYVSLPHQWPNLHSCWWAQRSFCPSQSPMQTKPTWSRVLSTILTSRRLNACWLIVRTLYVLGTIIMPESLLGVIVTESSLTPPKLTLLLFPGRGSPTTRLGFVFQCEVFFISKCARTHHFQRPYLKGAHLLYCCGSILKTWRSVWRSVLFLFYPCSCCRFTRASSGPIQNIVFISGPVPPSATLNFWTRFREERQDLSATQTSLLNLLLSMLAAGWPPYLYFTDTTTVTVVIALLSSCLCRPLRNHGAWHPYTVHRYRARTDTSLSSSIARTSRELNFLTSSRQSMTCNP